MSGTPDTLRWEPRTLPTIELERILTDVLADLWADAFRTGNPHFQAQHFRERLEVAVGCATGVQCAGLPASRKPATAGRDDAREALAHAFGDAYEQGNGNPDYHAAEIALGALEREGIVLHADRAAVATRNPAGAPRVTCSFCHGRTVRDVDESRPCPQCGRTIAAPENAPVPLAAVPRSRHPLNEAGHKRGDAA